VVIVGLVGLVVTGEFVHTCVAKRIEIRQGRTVLICSKVMDPPNLRPKSDILHVLSHAHPSQVIESCIRRAITLVRTETDVHGLLHRTMFRCLLDADPDILRKVVKW
jgi:hypothetical protein